jgi:hypothetical protein
VSLDPASPVVALCVAGMEVEGTPELARGLFEQAWTARRNDYEASIAAHFLARHQATPVEALKWNLIAVRHAEAVPDGSAAELMASLYLNLGDSFFATAQMELATAAVMQAEANLPALPTGGYRAFLESGVLRLRQRLEGTDVAPAI